MEHSSTKIQHPLTNLLECSMNVMIKEECQTAYFETDVGNENLAPRLEAISWSHDVKPVDVKLASDTLSSSQNDVNDESWIKKEPCGSIDLSPDTQTIGIHSRVDDIVSRDAQLENDIAGKPLYNLLDNNMEGSGIKVEREHSQVALLTEESRKGSEESLEPKCGRSRRKKRFNTDTNGALKSIDHSGFRHEKGNKLACLSCSKQYVCISSLKKHMIQKHRQRRDLSAFVLKDGPDSQGDGDSQRVWFCPRKCKYLTPDNGALSDHLATCQKPDLLQAEQVEVESKLDPFEVDKNNSGDSNTRGVVCQSQDGGQGLATSGQTSEQHQRQTPVFPDIRSSQNNEAGVSSRLPLKAHGKDFHRGQHQSRHSGDKLFQCSYCCKGFRYRSSLVRHSRAHTGEKPFKCRPCDKSFAHRSGLLEHSRTHTGAKLFSCRHCDKSFVRRNVFLEHTKRHTGERSFKCNHCCESYSRERDLVAHVVRIHTGSNQLMCPHCLKSSSVPGPVGTQTEEGPFRCQHCDTILSHRYSFVSNIRKHTLEQPFKFKCSHCDKAFRFRSKHAEHVRIHTGEKPFKCSRCDKSFRFKSELTVHVRIHTGEKPFKCSRCDKSFNRKDSLCQHIRTHTGEKPFRCSHCDKSFTRKDNLGQHIKTHASEKPYKCSHCNVSFSCHRAFGRHIGKTAGERPYKCNHCYESFCYKSALLRHIRKHAGEKPFKCSHCNKSVICRYSLVNHVRTHTGDKPFHCSQCHKSFCTKTALAHHHNKIHMLNTIQRTPTPVREKYIFVPVYYISKPKFQNPTPEIVEVTNF